MAKICRKSRIGAGRIKPRRGPATELRAKQRRAGRAAIASRNRDFSGGAVRRCRPADIAVRATGERGSILDRGRAPQPAIEGPKAIQALFLKRAASSEPLVVSPAL